MQTGGVYYGLPGVDPWDEARDARLYPGPHPVVAHPPCARWSRLAGFTEARFGYPRGQDYGCFAAALAAVRAWGGVLEHPAHSAAFAAHGLPAPYWTDGWSVMLDGGAVCYVEQGRYGLPLKKASWLYAYGCELPELEWGYTPDSEGEPPEGSFGRIDGWRDQLDDGRADQWVRSVPEHNHRNGARSTRHMGVTAMTPPAFRDQLLAMARTAGRVTTTT